MKTTALESQLITRRIIWIVALAIVATGVMVGVFIWESTQDEFDKPNHWEASPTIEHNGVTYVINPDTHATLLIGLDAFSTTEPDSYINDKQADFILLLVFNETEKNVRALHINRDTMTEMNVLGVTGQPIGSIVRQLALSHTYGNGKNDSCRNVANAVSNLLGGIRIEQYISITMDGVQILNDAVGGVTVEVIGDLTSMDPALREGEKVTLMGQQALTYVRSRYGVQDGTNLSRMERQRQYLSALYEQMATAVSEQESFGTDVAQDISEYIVTSYSVGEIESLFESFDDYEFQGIRTIEGEAVMGNTYMEFYPDQEDLMEAIIEMLYEPKNP